MHLEIIDNFLQGNEFNYLKNIILNELTWKCNGKNGWAADNDTDITAFYSYVIKNNQEDTEKAKDIMPCFNPLIEKFGLPISVRAIMSARTVDHITSAYHTDMMSDGYKIQHTAALFYMTTHNGGTQFNPGVTVDAIENRLIIFDGNIEHRAISNTDSNDRLVINFNFVHENK